jgi:hypothetical protein
MPCCSRVALYPSEVNRQTVVHVYPLEKLAVAAALGMGRDHLDAVLSFFVYFHPPQWPLPFTAAPLVN